MEIAHMTPNDFLKIIQQESMPLDKIPDGWYSAIELAKMWGVTISSVQKKIKTGKELGYVTEKKFLIKRDRIMRIPHYKFHEKENNQKDNQRKVMEDTIGSCRKDKRSR
jgi:hypothetical protein